MNPSFSFSPPLSSFFSSLSTLRSTLSFQKIGEPIKLSECSFSSFFFFFFFVFFSFLEKKLHSQEYFFNDKETRLWSLMDGSALTKSITVLWVLVVSGSTMMPSRVLPEAMAVGIPFGVV